MAIAGSWVLHLSSELGWRGGERQVCLLARGLARRGVRQAVAAPARSPLAHRAAGGGELVVRLYPRPALHPANIMRLVAAARGRPGVILHAHTSPTLSLAWLVRRLAPVRAVVHTRRVAFPVRPSQKYRTAADRYVAISQAVADGLLGAGLDPGRLEVIPSAVDLEPLDAARPAPELASLSRPVVGCVGQLSAEKGQASLAEAWPSVLREHPGATLVLVGDGPERARVERLTAQVPERIVLAGFRDDVPSWLKGLDLYAQPSLAEGLGTSVLDAMGCRLPVVASRIGGLPEVVGAHTGLLVPPGDPAALADAITALLSDPARARSMGEAGRRRVAEEFGVDRMVERYLGVYRAAGA